MVLIKANIVDIISRKIFAGEILVKDNKIFSIENIDEKVMPELAFVLPGFIDSHVHIESSMLIPAEFAKLAVVHGTVATVSDPHEIANVCGIQGIEFMIENGLTVPFKFNFGAPSCVPATNFETAGASLNSDAVYRLLQRSEIKYLSEMMNFPGVLTGDEEVMKKIKSCIALGKPVDGHAPALRGTDAKKYIEAGEPGKIIISTDHECFTADEALDKLQHGMKILIREGSAAKNFEALVHLLHHHYNNIMFCSDDKHPDSLVEGHINTLCARAVAKGIDVFKVLQAACINPVLHYKLDVGLLQPGDAADFILVQDLQHFKVLKTFINGRQVAENGQSKIEITNQKNNKPVNNFNCTKKIVADFTVPAGNTKTIAVIEALEAQLITNKLLMEATIENDCIVSNVEKDMLKIVVVNRYAHAPVAKSFIKNFGFTKGAIASSVAHDSHNIVAVGVDDESICQAVNLIIEKQGGISCAAIDDEMVLPLPVAGLMSMEDGYAVAKNYTAIDAMAKKMGSKLQAPFMTLSFMALLVIPYLKLSDKGLFDVDSWKII
jgi:adenine deaminase